MEVNNMNKGIIIAGVVILIIVGGGLFIVSQQSQKAEDAKMTQEKADKNTPEQEAMEKNNSVMEKTNDSKMMGNTNSRYVMYSKSEYDKAAGNRRVLFFYASWCPTCRPTDANLKESTSKIPEDVIVIRVNYNDPETDQEEKDLAKKYGVTYQHTFVQIDSEGKEVAKWNGGQIDELIAKIK